MSTSFFVTGSINTDLNVSVDRFPAPGETVTGLSFNTAFGGKGANQAVALSRLAKTGKNTVVLAGKTGIDGYGEAYRDYLAANGIDTRLIAPSAEPTGTALIEIDSSGVNRIVVVPGANHDISEPWWAYTMSQFAHRPGDIFLFQLEIPVPVVTRAIIDAHAASGIVILDPAPAVGLPEELWHSIDIITPNQTETAFYSGIYPSNDTEAAEAGRLLLKKGVKTVIIKAGDIGSWLFTAEEHWFCPVFPVTVKDTTAAGDSFNAGFAFALGGGKNLPDALRFANAVGGLSTTRNGAQTAMPDLDTVEALLRASPRIGPRRL